MATLPTPRIPLPSPSPSSTNPNPKFLARTSNFLPNPSRPSLHRLKRHRHHRSNHVVCRCRNPSSDDRNSNEVRWDFLFQDAVRRCKDFLSSYWSSLSSDGKEQALIARKDDKGNKEREKGEKEMNEKEEEEEEENGEWSWERWKRHFAETEENERLFYALKLQLTTAVAREDYKSAQRMKLAIATASKYDAVGRAISDLTRAIEEERYGDAAYIRDHAGAGLLGWWAGLSGNVSDPNGLIIRITAEYGRYVARCYSSRQLATSGSGTPLFEIYFAERNGEYKQQAVYIKPSSSSSGGFPNIPLGKSDISSIYLSDSSLGGGKGGAHMEESTNLDEEEKDESDSDFQDFSQNNNHVIPPFKILSITSSGKIDRDHIAKIIDQISEAEDDENEDDDDDDTDGDFEISETEMETEMETSDVSEDESEIRVTQSPIRLPARLERNNRISFTLYVEKQEEKKRESSGTQQIKRKKPAVISRKSGVDLLLPDLARFGGGKKRISVKIIIPERRPRNKRANQGLPSITHFRRIMIPNPSDPLNGLYMAASGLDSEIVYLKRKFGQWREDGDNQRDLEFYEYVEAVKLTGDHLVPAGQVVFRAKVGKQHQLPHKGLIPKELGVVARYKGQGRIVDIGFKNPHWVDGELLILDGKFIRDGPVIGFFYWASNFHLFEFFSRLRLPD